MQNVKEKIKKIYEKYNINEEIIESIIKEVYKTSLSEEEIINLATLKIEQYIAEEIRKGNKEYQDLIEKSNGGLKILIKRISSCSKLTEAQLDRFYSKAIEYSSNHYDSTYSLKNNIYNSMKTLSSNKSFMKSIVTDTKSLKPESKVQEENPISEGSKNVEKTQSNKSKIQTTIKKQTERLVNISFLNNLPKGKQIDTYELVDILRISYNGVKKALLGEIEIRESLLQPLYFKEKVKNFEEYKKVMEGYANQESKKKSIPIDNLPSKSELLKSELESVAKISKNPAHSNLDKRRETVKNKEKEEKIDISFLKGLITSIKLGEILGVSNVSAGKYLNGKALINKIQQDKLLKYYECRTMEELQEKLIKEQNENEKVDISFLKGLITSIKLGEILGVSQRTAHRYLDGKTLINEIQEDKLLKYYGCKTMEELQEKLGKKMDISFLKGLITEKKLAEILGVSPSTAHDYLKGITKIDKEQQDKLLKHYGCDTIEELKEKLIKEQKENEKVDISFLKGLITEKKLAEILGVSQSTAYRYLKGITKIDKEQQDKLIDYCECERIEEVKDILAKKLEKEKLSKVKDESIKKVDESKEVETKIEDSTQIVEEQEPTKKNKNDLSPKETVKDELLESVDTKVLLTIIKSKMTKDDLLIAYLLFGGYKEQYYSIDAISNFLKIEKEYVIYIKRRCLEEYKSVFDSMRLYNEKYMNSISEGIKKPPVYEETDNI